MKAITKKNIKQEFLSNFIPQEFLPQNTALLKIKEEAESALQNLEFPTSRDEQWKYTRIAKILKNKYTQTPAKIKSGINLWKIQEAHFFVFVNGFFYSELSKIGKEKNSIIKPISLARKENSEILEKYFGKIAQHKTEIFTALNTVYHTNGAFIFVNENLKKPIHIVNISASENAAFNPRNLIVLGKNSSAKIIFSHEKLSKSSELLESSFVNSVTEIFLEENSHLSFYLLENKNSFHINSINAEMKSNAKAEFFTLTKGGNIVRNNLKISLNGENCEAQLNGLYIGKNENHIDNHTVVEHKKPNSYSNELYKGIMTGKSTGVFNGKVHVDKDAQKTNAYQQNQNILLSDDATINSKPELEIYADDVKCSHGSTTGQIDEEAIFYLRSRGIEEEKAKQLLIRAFAEDIVNKISVVEVKNYVESLLEKSLEK